MLWVVQSQIIDLEAIGGVDHILDKQFAILNSRCLENLILSLRKDVNMLCWVIKINHDELTVWSIKVGLEIEFGTNVMDSVEITNPFGNKWGKFWQRRELNVVFGLWIFVFRGSCVSSLINRLFI